MFNLTDESFFEMAESKTDSDWQGLGISSIMFNPLNPKILLCVTHKN